MKPIIKHCSNAYFFLPCSGVDIVALLEYLGASETVIKPFQSSGLGNFAGAYLLYKIATPARYTVTVVGTQLSARQLRRWGYLHPVPPGDNIKNLMSESKVKVRDRYDHLKDDVKDFKGKVEDLRSDVKERAEEFRGEMKGKIQTFGKNKNRR